MTEDGYGTTIGSLFSGVGGLELGLEWAGLGPVVWQVERDEFCQRVLARHWPNAERFDDVRDVGAGALAHVDLLCGGFPCQDVSAAGSGDGLRGSRSGLWSEFERLVGVLRPTWVVVENVASGAKRWVDPVRTQLGARGYETLPVPLAAVDCGAPHLRRRVFVVGRRAPTDGNCRRCEGEWGRRNEGSKAKPGVSLTDVVVHGRSVRGDQHGARTISGRLAPEFTGWLMGLPPGWTETD